MKMRSTSILAATLTLGLSFASMSAGAEESQAKSWNLLGEQATRLSGTVVDIRCELGSDSAEACGAGKRQIGIKTADRLVLVAKNFQTSFNGATVDLAPYCGKEVETDGLLAGHSDVEIYQVQLIREAGASEWQKATSWTKAWAAANPEQKGKKGPWFRHDPRVHERINKEGYLGLGLDVDAAFIESEQ